MGTASRTNKQNREVVVVFGSPVVSLSLGILGSTMASAKALTAEKCLLDSFGLYCLLCRAGGPLATPDSKGLSRGKEVKIF